MRLLTATLTPVVFVPPVPAAQTSITDCGTEILFAVSSAWQLVLDRPLDWSLPTLAGSWIVAAPWEAGTGARDRTRLLVIVTCSE